MKLVNRVLGVIRDSDGPFTKAGKLLNYAELHSFLLGLRAGIRHQPQQESFDRDQENMSHPVEWQYWSWGYTAGNKGVWAFLGALGSLIGPDALQVIM